MSNNIIDVMPIMQEVLSAEDFLDLKNNNPHLIASSQIMPPKLGDNNFGGIAVQYSRPLYKHLERFTKK